MKMRSMMSVAGAMRRQNTDLMGRAQVKKTVIHTPYILTVRGRHRRDPHRYDCRCQSGLGPHPYAGESTEYVAALNRAREARAGSVAPDVEDEPAATWAAEGSKMVARVRRRASATYWDWWKPLVSPNASSEAAEQRAEPPAAGQARTHAAARLRGLQAAEGQPRPIVP